jgi:hypothetical protein
MGGNIMKITIEISKSQLKKLKNYIENVDSLYMEEDELFCLETLRKITAVGACHEPNK